MATNEIAAALQIAIESGNFEASSALARRYREAVSQELRNAVSPDERIALARETIAFLEDRLHLARVLRAHVSSRLASAFHVQSYSAEPPRESLWRLDA